MTDAVIPDVTGGIAALRAAEFSRLDAAGEVYADYTGSGLYPESLVARHAERLARGIFGNPHSDNPASGRTTRMMEDAREAVLGFFDADPERYLVIFTANASAALKLVGEAWPFGPGSTFVLTVDNHNSVNGIRELAGGRGARVVYLPIDDELRIAGGVEAVPEPAGSGPHLFACPAQSNFSGVQHPLSLVERAQAAGYDVLLDAAAFVPTNPLSLRRVSPEYVAISFYKMFGFPTGIGALIAQREALARLRRPWFAGGTVDFVSVQNHMHALTAGEPGFEDGTPDFLASAAVVDGLEFLRQVPMAAIHHHVAGLTGRLLERLLALRHPGGAPAVRIYGPATMNDRGGTVAFNLLDPAGEVIAFDLVERSLGTRGISVRGGCFCNPGASEMAFHMDAVASRRCLESFAPGEFSLEKFAACMGMSTVGAVRVSLGLPSNDEDVKRIVEALAEVGGAS